MQNKVYVFLYDQASSVNLKTRLVQIVSFPSLFSILDFEKDQKGWNISLIAMWHFYEYLKKPLWKISPGKLGCIF